MGKFLSIVTVMILIALSAVAFVACGDNEPDEPFPHPTEWRSFQSRAELERFIETKESLSTNKYLLVDADDYNLPIVYGPTFQLDFYEDDSGDEIQKINSVLHMYMDIYDEELGYCSNFKPGVAGSIKYSFFISLESIPFSGELKNITFEHSEKTNRDNGHYEVTIKIYARKKHVANFKYYTCLDISTKWIENFIKQHLSVFEG